MDHFLKTKKKHKQLNKQEVKKLDKVCFQHDIAYVDFKDLLRITVSDKVLRDKAFIIANNQKYDRYQRGLASMLYSF